MRRRSNTWKTNFSRARRFLLTVVLSFALAIEAKAAPDKAASSNTSREKLQLRAGYAYERPGIFTFVTRIPGDIADFAKGSIRKENVPWVLAIGVSTGLLIWKDQWLVNKAYEAGDRLHISHTSHQKALVSLSVGKSLKLNLDGPYDSGSALYFIGDGLVDLGLAGGFVGFGLAKNDHRALQTASQIGESVFASGAIVQILKHLTGRESPFASTRSGGRWVPFPNQIEYHKHVPVYDAYPSGHLAAGLATATVIAENYPEYRFIRPVGYTLLGALSFQMMNNGVHWASDYPLAIALGYGFGRIAVRKGRRQPSNSNVFFFPTLMGNEGLGLQALMRLG